MTSSEHTATHVHDRSCFWAPDRATWVCAAPAADAAPGPTVDDDLVDVRDMVVVHTALLREFRLAAPAVVRTTPGDRKRAATVDDHLQFVCDLLHHHHEGEDELLWPVLRPRVGTEAQAVIDAAEEQHAGLDAALGRVGAARSSWRAEPSAAHRDVLAAALQELHGLLAEHLELEERALLPLAAAGLTHAEWHALGASAVAALPKPVLPLVFGMFAYEGDPAVLRAMLAPAPALPRMLIPRIAPRAYARRAARVHGTRRP